MKRLFFILLLTTTCCITTHAAWTTHLSYNTVEQIAAGDGEVYGVSSGALFSINAQSEKIKTYSHQNGMHGTQIVCIAWLEPIHSLLIAYESGKIDILHNGTFTYIPDLYNKYTTLSKRCNCVVLHDSLAYMGMDYGIQTFNMQRKEFVDSYFIGPEASETSIRHIAIVNDVLYAASDSDLYAIQMDDNMVDYAYWASTPLPKQGYIQSMVQTNGVLYILIDNICYARTNGLWQQMYSNTYNALSIINGTLYPADYPAVSHDGIWMAAGENGVLRQMPTGELLTYKLNGPLTNTPYRITFQQGQLFSVPGGRWAVQYSTPGAVMRYDGTTWHNVSDNDIKQAVGGECLDLMNVAVDPNNPSHYFVTSYGTGLYEFNNDVCIKRWNSENSIIGSASKSRPNLYTRTDGAIYDKQGNLWFMNSGNIDYNIIVFTSSGEQVGMNILNPDGSRYMTETVGQLLFDRRDNNKVWALVPRGKEARGAGIALIDTKGTLNNTDDDQITFRTQWEDQNGTSYNYDAIYAIQQDIHNNLWAATNNGIFIIPQPTVYHTSNLCQMLSITEDNGNVLFANEQINDICLDHNGNIWIATSTKGVFVLSADADAVIAQYTTDNSALPSNSILSLAFDDVHKHIFIGSGDGLVEYDFITSDLHTIEPYTDQELTDGSMLQWTTHFAYTDIDAIALSSSKVYAISAGSLCSIDKQDESIHYYSKLNGLNGSSITHIEYDTYTQSLLIAYEDGMLDQLSENGSIYSIADLYLKQMSTSKQVQAMSFNKGMAYLGMPFGVLAVNMRKHEISDTYYLGPNGSEISVTSISTTADSIYVLSENTLYKASLNANLVDYSVWEHEVLPYTPTQICHNDDLLYILMDSSIYCTNTHYTRTKLEGKDYVSICVYNNKMLALTADGRIYTIQGTTATEQTALSIYNAKCAVADGPTTWIGTSAGILRIDPDHSVQLFEPDGPSSNMPYGMTTVGSRLWIVPGGRWASGYLREGQVMCYNGSVWNNLTYDEICRRMGNVLSLYDFGHVAVDPANYDHFYVASFGTGLIEFKPDGTARRYTHDNSPLESLLTSSLRYRYCRVDALTYDTEGNLWLTNTGSQATNIHIIDPQGQWHSFDLYNGSQRIVLTTVSKMLVDNRNPNYMWIASARETTGLILLNHNGTPYQSRDDRTIMRSTFIDQDNKSINPTRINCIAQDVNGDMWLGTNEGIIVIDASTNFFSSNACKRLKISRHDGTNLADYLLGTEQINAIAFAGGNRIWIATDASGVYLVHMVTKEGIYEPEIIEHFTSYNSPMPSDCVLSLAIDGETGEVYIGTAKGLVSYKGDATDPSDTYSNAYVYPNPVRPEYQGVITIAGLMDNTTVYITDAAGNVVCRTHSNGGTAIWDGHTLSGKKARTGVYTVYCNTADGTNHAVVKVLLLN